MIASSRVVVVCETGPVTQQRHTCLVKEQNRLWKNMNMSINTESNSQTNVLVGPLVTFATNQVVDYFDHGFLFVWFRTTRVSSM